MNSALSSGLPRSKYSAVTESELTPPRLTNPLPELSRSRLRLTDNESSPASGEGGEET
jgi:hypothetical protein